MSLRSLTSARLTFAASTVIAIATLLWLSPASAQGRSPPIEIFVMSLFAVDNENACNTGMRKAFEIEGYSDIQVVHTNQLQGVIASGDNAGMTSVVECRLVAERSVSVIMASAGFSSLGSAAAFAQNSRIRRGMNAAGVK